MPQSRDWNFKLGHYQNTRRQKGADPKGRDSHYLGKLCSPILKSRIHQSAAVWLDRLTG
jgi:hypothetical protein